LRSRVAVIPTVFSFRGSFARVGLIIATKI